MKDICTDSKCSEMKTWNNGRIRAISKLENMFQKALDISSGRVIKAYWTIYTTYTTFSFLLFSSFSHIFFFCFLLLFAFSFSSIFHYFLFFTYQTLIWLNCNWHHNNIIQSQVSIQTKVWKVYIWFKNSNLELVMGMWYEMKG